MSKLKKCRQCGADRHGRVCSQCGREEKRGGPGRGGGPKPRLILPAIHRAQAKSVLEKLGHDYKGKRLPTEHELWLGLIAVADMRLRFEVMKYLTDRRDGRPVQQVRMGNPEGERFDVNVVTSAREKLAALLGA